MNLYSLATSLVLVLSCVATGRVACSPRRCSCGLENVDVRVIGGRDVASRQPWMVGLVVQRNGDIGYCGGTLINDRFVLTAAHCIAGVAPQSIGVKLGALTLTEMKRKSGQLVADAISFAYDRDTGKNDIALIKLVEPVTFSDSVAPVCLASDNDLTIALDTFVTGWGLTSPNGHMSHSLQQVNLPLTAQQVCNKLWWDFDTESQICGGLEHQSACKGDSGGPLLTRTSDGRITQLGITSYSSIHCNDSPTVFTRISAFSEAIQSAVDRADALDGTKTLWCD